MRRWSVIILALAAMLAWPARADDLPRLIAAAPPGATIIVPPGVHDVHLRLDKPVTLVGTPGAVLDGEGRGDVVRIAAPDVAVRNLVIRDSGRDLTTTNAGVFVEKEARDATVADNRIEHVLFGVYLDGPAGTRVTGNTIRGIPGLRQSDRGDGIHLWNDTGVVVKSNDIGDTRDGIYMYISPRNAIVGNRLHGVRYGIHYMYSNHDIVAGNVSIGNRSGFAIMQSSHLDVRDNVARGDHDYGFLLNYVTFSDFRGNIVKNVTGEKGVDGVVVLGGEGKGIFVYNSEYDRFLGNTIADSPIGIHLTAGSDHDIFSGNAFVNNRIQVKYAQNVDEEWSWHGRGNYWSDYLGWDMNGDGLGDAPYRPDDGVDVLLWDYPGAALLMSSPAILVLRYVQRVFPVFTPPSVEDSHPLMKPPAAAAGRKQMEVSNARH